MTNIQKEFLLNHLQDLEKQIEYTFAEITQSHPSISFFVSNAASVASEIACLQAQQRAICYTLRQLGYYVTYDNGHATDIVADEE